MYWVADQIDATNDNHVPQIPIVGNTDNKNIYRRLLLSGLSVVPTANNRKNAAIDIIWSVVFILPIEKRALGTGISIFCVPGNSRSPEMYSSRAVINIIGIMINHTGIIIASISIEFTTSNLSPMWSITPPNFEQALYLRARF